MTKSRKDAGVVAVLLIGGAVAAFEIAWRPAIAAIDPPGPQSCGDRQLHDVSYGARGQGFCRWAAGADAVRYDLLLEYHAGSGDRDRPLAGGRIPSRDALGRRSQRPASLSDLSLRSLHQCPRRG